jgi:hypothetical protein
MRDVRVRVAGEHRRYPSTVRCASRDIPLSTVAEHGCSPDASFEVGM